MYTKLCVFAEQKYFIWFKFKLYGIFACIYYIFCINNGTNCHIFTLFMFTNNTDITSHHFNRI